MCLYLHVLFCRRFALRGNVSGQRAAVGPARGLPSSSTALPLHLLGVLDAPLSRQPGEEGGKVQWEKVRSNKIMRFIWRYRHQQSPQYHSFTDWFHRVKTDFYMLWLTICRIKAPQSFITIQSLMRNICLVLQTTQNSSSSLGPPQILKQRVWARVGGTSVGPQTRNAGSCLSAG